jgi:hypothetical protein
MSDYRIDAATKEEWAERALKAEAKVADLEDRYGYIEEVWRDLYSDNIRQSVSIETMRENFEKIRDTSTEKYLDVLEQFVEYMEKASIYKK